MNAKQKQGKKTNKVEEKSRSRAVNANRVAFIRLAGDRMNSFDFGKLTSVGIDFGKLDPGLIS